MFYFTAFGQYTISVESDQAHFFRNLPSDSLLLSQKISEIEKNLHQDGFLEAKLNHCIFLGKKAEINFWVGKKYTWGELQKGNLSEDLAQKIGFSEKNFRKKILKWAEIVGLFHQILTFSQNSGYPFAEVFLDSLQIKDSKFYAKIHYKANEKVRFDSLMLYGKLKIKPNFLKNYLRLSYKQNFNQAELDKAQKALERFPFLYFSKPPQVFFLYDKAYWQLFLEKKNSNEIDGIVGFLPNAKDNSLLITGQLQLKLDNLFASAKTLHLNWQRLRAESQLLEISYQHPAFLGSRFDVSFGLKINKQDSSFLNINQLAEIAYRFGQNKIVFFYKNLESSTTDTLFRSQESKPKISGFAWQSYGFWAEIDRLDNVFSPRKGYYIKAGLNFGNKKLDLDSSRQNILQSEISGQFQAYMPTGKNSTILIDCQTSHLTSSRIFVNEFYQIGGFRRLRGFNENSFFVKSYTIITAEYRLYFGENSSLFSFVDYGFWASEKALGMGGGLSFQTKNGIFRFMYALGSSQNQSLSPQNSKIHFGLMSRF